ncbi:MAG TPA: ATP-binding cassette domain-containing protein, partial [Capillimicrobium sp.]|nr:ATP-binding cassette domain-containing protein [Capillimicrobium sp.]
MPDGDGIVVEALARAYRGGVRAVDGIDLRVEPGEIYGFLGPNGAGKSTTVLMLTTLLPPSGGTARVAGHDIRREGAAVRRAIGAALQEAALDPLLTGREHLRLQTALHGIPKADRARRAGELLERVGLLGAADRRVGGYSGGMKRRLDLALALVHRPRVLFLDEPTTGLDPTSRGALWREVRALNEDGTTVFLTTQYLEEAEQLAGRVGIIARGSLVAEGTPAELKRRVGEPTLHVDLSDPDDVPAAREALSRIGELTACDGPARVAIRVAEGRAAIPPVIRALDELDIAVESLELESPTLDDV